MSDTVLKSWGIASYKDELFDIEIVPSNTSSFCLEVRITLENMATKEVSSYKIFLCSPDKVLDNFVEITEELTAFSGNVGKYIFGRGLFILPLYEVNLIERTLYKELQNLKLYAIDVT